MKTKLQAVRRILTDKATMRGLIAAAVGIATGQMLHLDLITLVITTVLQVIFALIVPATDGAE